MLKYGRKVLKLIAINMSWFSSNNYSQVEKMIVEAHLKKLCSWVGMANLTQTESLLVFNALSNRRGMDGRISLHQIYEVLNQLKEENKISKYDRDGLMKRFQEYFEKSSE